MHPDKLYNDISKIAVELYQNSGEGLTHIKSKIGELTEFLTIFTDEFPEKIVLLQQCIAQLNEAVTNSDKILLADLLYYDICQFIEEYAAYNGQPLNKIEKNSHAKESEQHVRIQANCYEKNRIEFRNCKHIDYTTCIQYCDNFNSEDDTVALDVYANFAVYKNNRWWRLNSFYNSQMAAKLGAMQFSAVGFHGLLIIYGLGNMDYINAIFQQIPFDTVVIIHEPNEKVFAMNMYYNDMKCIVEHENTFLFVRNINDDNNFIEEYITRYYNSDMLQTTYSWILPNYDVLYSEEILEKKKYFDEMDKAVRYFKNTRYIYGGTVSRNRIKNISLLADSIWISDLKKCFQKKIDFCKIPAIIVAAGPSLDKNIELLKEAKGKAFIFAVDSAVRMLEKHHIQPDAVVTTDPVKEKVLFENKVMKNSPLFYCLESVHDNIKNLKGRKIFYNNNGGNCQLLNCFSKDSEALEIRGSVSNVAIGLARYMGFKTIIVIGLDLAFKGNKKHADVVYNDGDVNKAEEWAYTYVQGQNGEQLLTYDNFVYYKREIERLIEEAGESLQFINATEGGALIEGAECMTLQKAISKYCSCDVDIEQIIKNCQDSFLGEDKNCVTECIEKFAKECDELSTSFRKCIKLYEEIFKSKNTEAMLNRLNKIQEQEKYQESCAMMSTVRSISQKETDQCAGVKNETSSNDTYAFVRTISKEGLNFSRIYLKNVKIVKELLLECMKTMSCDGD